MANVFIHHNSSLLHDTGNHPERRERIIAIEQALADQDWLGYEVVEAPAIDLETLRLVHTSNHIDQIKSLAESGGGWLDLDTVVSSGSYKAALHSAGGAVKLIDLLLTGQASGGFACLRPPGHHAYPDQSGGFCLFNNIAIAAQHALTNHKLERIFIFDWDVHHGNGTEAIFYDNPKVFYSSIHQYPFYPGTGAKEDIGVGEGKGFNLNLPVPAGSGGGLFRSLVEQVVIPAIENYQPQVLLVSAGYDAHRADPIGGCDLTADDYAAMTSSLLQVCQKLGISCGFILEGGYDLTALSDSVTATMNQLIL